eukprot:6213114-Pleurochrysis_carterae.AAC.1
MLRRYHVLTAFLGRAPHNWLYLNLCTFCVVPCLRATSRQETSSRDSKYCPARTKTGGTLLWDEFRKSINCELGDSTRTLLYPALLVLPVVPGWHDTVLTYHCRSRSSAVQYGRRDRILKYHARILG